MTNRIITRALEIARSGTLDHVINFLWPFGMPDRVISSPEWEAYHCAERIIDPKIRAARAPMTLHAFPHRTKPGQWRLGRLRPTKGWLYETVQESELLSMMRRTHRRKFIGLIESGREIRLAA